MAQRITALALIVGLFEALYSIISRPAQSIHTVAEELKLNTGTRVQFLESIVKFAQAFLEKGPNKQEFSRMLIRAAQAEKKELAGSLTISDKEKGEGAWIAEALAKCSRTTVHKLFELIYASPTFSPIPVLHFS